MNEILFISDLHLSKKRPEITLAFLHFLKHRASSAKALYILGDLFDFWVGDDCVEQWQIEIVLALKQYSKNHKIYFMRGNRDFLIGHDFCKKTGCVLLSDEHKIDLDGKTALLLHGDTLCTLDKGYLRYRRITRNKVIQKIFLALPERLRRKIARLVRNNSKSCNYRPDSMIMDAQPDAIVSLTRQKSAKILIHGHTHKPAQHAHILCEKEGKQTEVLRWVLGDWDRQWWVLSYSNGHFAQESYPLKKTQSEKTDHV